jgi:hypothetical protein
MLTLNDHLRNMPAATRPIVEAALEVVRSAALDAEEAVYQTKPPKKPGTMWKLVHFKVGGEYVAGIGTFRDHATLFFYRGLELHDDAGLLTGRGKQFRSVTLRTAAEAKAPELVRLTREAFDLSR